MSGMEVWPNDSFFADFRFIDDENMGREIKSALFGKVNQFLGIKRVVRKLEDIQRALYLVVGDTSRVNLVHELIVYGVPLPHNKNLGFGLSRLEDDPFNPCTEYIVQVYNN